MTGDDIVAAMLRDNPALTAVVPVAQINVAALPDNTPLPNLLVTQTTSVDRQFLKQGPSVRVIDRVSVKVRAGNHLQRRAVIRLVRACCAGKTGSIGGGSNVAIMTAGQGPDLSGPGTSYEKTQDFRVSFDDPT